MVTKSTAGTKKKGKTKVGKLKLNRETVKNLSDKEQKKVKGGALQFGGASRSTTTCHCP